MLYHARANAPAGGGLRARRQAGDFWMTRWVPMGVVVWSSLFASLAHAHDPSAPGGLDAGGGPEVRTDGPEPSSGVGPVVPPLAPSLAERITCVESHEAGQVQRLEGNLTQARALFETCATELCPALVREDCARWLVELGAELPTLAQPSDPTEPPPVALPASPALAPATTSEGQRAADAQRASASTSHATAGAASPATPAAPTISYVLSGVAVLSLGTGIGFAVDASDREGSARRGEGACAPMCGEARVDAMQRSALIADIGFGVAIAAATGALIAYLAQDDVPTGRSSRSMQVLAW